VIYADMEKPGSDDVVEKVMADIATHGVDISEADVRSKMEVFEATAKKEIEAEFPDALDSDHEGAG
jgi:hypothetical protein